MTGAITGAVTVAGISVLALSVALPEPAVAAPIVLTGAAAAAVVGAFLLQARAHAAASDALAWVALGHALAALTMVAALPGLAAAAQGAGNVPDPKVTALALVGHVLVPVFALVGLLGGPGRMVRALTAAAGVAGVAVLASSGVGLPAFVGPGGRYTAVVSSLLAVTAGGAALAAACWADRRRRRSVPAGGWVVASLALAALGAGAHALSVQPFDQAWWASSWLRLGQMVVLSAGLLHGVVVLLAQLGEVQRRLADTAARVDDLARRDALTGLFNARTFVEVATVALARDDGEHRSLVMLDVEAFRAYNEQLGPAEGDRLLAAVADALRRNVRPDDLVARIGGDEFALVLRHSDSTTAARVVDRIGERLHGIAELSAGIATTNRPVPVDTLLHEAAAQMEVARRNGISRRATFVQATPPAEPAFA